MKSFAIIGAAGYIAPRHMQAIRDTNNVLLAALDPNDSVGIIDSFFPQAKFFTEFERFDRHIDKLHRSGDVKIDYISICSPNYLHDSHMRFGLRSGSDVICEKPLVLNPWNLDALSAIEVDTNQKVNTILQLRVHPSIIELQRKIKAQGTGTKFDVDLTYVTSRGNWYAQSWKGDHAKSGGIATNIGVHFFDMLYFLFGNVQKIELHENTSKLAAGYLEFANARVRWFMSLDIENVPEKLRSNGVRTYRSITIDKEEVEFSGGFTDLHTRSYEEIIAGRGFGLEENRSAIETVSRIRDSELCSNPTDLHPLLQRD